MALSAATFFAAALALAKEALQPAVDGVSTHALQPALGGGCDDNSLVFQIIDDHAGASDIWRHYDASCAPHSHVVKMYWQEGGGKLPQVLRVLWSKGDLGFFYAQRGPSNATAAASAPLTGVRLVLRLPADAAITCKPV